MTDVKLDNEALRATLEDLLSEIETISKDYGPVVQAAVAEARDHELDRDVAERLYTDILTVLRAAQGSEQNELDIATEVQQLLAPVPVTGPWGSVPLVDWNGLTPHIVMPTPTFNNKAVVMYEGYVDVTKLDLWKANARVELQVAEFRDRQKREPTDDELLKLVQGELKLPSLSKKDPFNIEPLAKSIARKGVERAPILTSDGVPQDGNRRIAASKFVVSGKFTLEEKQRARYIKVWVAGPETTPDQFEAIVVALNFEDDLKEKWPEFVKARLVVEEYRKQRNAVTGTFTAKAETALRRTVGEQFAIGTTAVTRYIRMVQWAEDFESYHVDEGGKDPSAVRYKADDIFQWFYEIQAGKSADKITAQLDEDEGLRKIVYDLMFEVMDTGTQVRSLWKIAADPEAMAQLETAHEALEAKDKGGALGLVKEAVTTADRNTAARKKIGFETFLRSCAERLGQAPPDNWRTLDAKLLKDLERVFAASNGVIEAELVNRGERPAPAAD